MTMREAAENTGDLCQTCGVGFLLPSGRCDHCDLPLVGRCRVEITPVENPCAKILEHKWLDPKCVESGCQSLVLQLADNPADSEMPITREWLESIGGHGEWHPQKVTFRRTNPDVMPIGLWSVDDGWKAMLLHAEHSASCIVRGIKTFGQFRQLARALGITLEEAK